jgi:hypothetical protein
VSCEEKTRLTREYSAVPNTGGGRDRPNPLFNPRLAQNECRILQHRRLRPSADRGSWQYAAQLALRPDFRHVNLSLFKNFAVTERMNLQFRAEAYNISNTPNFIFPLGDGSTELGSTSFGKVSNFDPNYTPRLYQFALQAQL